MIGFGKYGKKRNLEINSLSDERLVEVDPTKEGFFDNVLNNSVNDKFIEAIREVQEVGVAPFYRPIMDPSMEGDKVVFNKGNGPAVGHSFVFWKQKAEEMPAVEGKNWQIGTEYQYYAFLTWLINQLVERGMDITEAIEAVVIDSRDLGNYKNSENSSHDFETTGNRAVCGVYDLANAFKILASSYEETGISWLAGGGYNVDSSDYPLANLSDDCFLNSKCKIGVGWLVLS